MPLLPQANSYNRNMVLSIGHSGVKFLLDRVTNFYQNQLKLTLDAENIKNKVLNTPATVNPLLLEQARQIGRQGIL